MGRAIQSTARKYNISKRYMERNSDYPYGGSQNERRKFQAVAERESMVPKSLGHPRSRQCQCRYRHMRLQECFVPYLFDDALYYGFGN